MKKEEKLSDLRTLSSNTPNSGREYIELNRNDIEHYWRELPIDEITIGMVKRSSMSMWERRKAAVVIFKDKDNVREFWNRWGGFVRTLPSWAHY